MIGLIFSILLFSFIFISANERKKKLESDFIWVEGTITKIKLNVPKGTTSRKDIFYFEYYHNGIKYKRTEQVYNPKLIKIGQKFKIKIHRVDAGLYDFELKGV
ncbi:hypothetical protein [Tenacibaculum xiamenense]|uniref:hypothetical protein n=1 Tax=Tenacibaculum xiamenense TaxID=1261553 RepID=UPI0038B5993B